MIVVIAKMRFQADGAAGAARALIPVIVPTRAEEGCLEYNVSESCESPGVFVFAERWRSEKDLRLHFETEHMLALRARLRSDLNLLELIADVYVAEDEARPIPL